MSALLSLGLFVFSIPTLANNELQRRTDWRYGRNPRFGAQDAVQYLGPGEDTISLTGVVYSDFADGETSLDQLRDMGCECRLASWGCWSILGPLRRGGAGRLTAPADIS